MIHDLKILKTLLSLSIVFLMIISLSGNAIAQEIETGASAQVSISVNNLNTDDLGSTAETMYYIIKDPYNKTSAQVLAKTYMTSTKAAQFSIASGTYSIGAFNPNLGWGVQVVKITSEDYGKPITVSLKLKPVAQNWTDLNGVFHEKLMTPPVLNNSMKSEESTRSLITYLLYEDTLEQVDVKVGELHSTEGVSVSMNLKFSASIESKLSIDGGPLQVSGYSSLTESGSNPLGPVSDGVSRNVIKSCDITYQEWLYDWPVYNEIWEFWFESYLYSVAAWLEGSPSPSFQSLDEMDNWINAKDSSVTKYLTFDNMSGWGWSIGESISCGTGWQVFSGSVNLGGSYSWNSYQSQETIYTIIVDSGRVINLYYNGGGVITYQNRYWAADSWGGVLSGSGTSQWVENARGLINYNIAEIYCPNYGDAAYLSVQLNSDEATGDIYIYGREPDGYINGHVYTYGCDDGINWQYIDDVYVTGVGGYQYFYMGTNPGYRYLCFAGYYHSGCSLCFQIDAVFVV